MNLTAAVVDDEKLARARLTRILKSLGVDVIAQGKNGVEAVRIVNNDSPDIMFLDINMPIKTGLEAAEDIDKLRGEAPAIIFCTAYQEYAIEAFQTQASAYLLKPVQIGDVEAALEKTLSVSRLQTQQMLASQLGVRSLSVNIGGNTQNLSVNRFLFFTSMDKNVFATLEGDEQILIDKTLKELELDYSDVFLRIHRSTLINRTLIKSMNKDSRDVSTVKIRGSDTELVVSRRHLSEVKKCFQ
jgi:two-component system response regulator AlgR